MRQPNEPDRKRNGAGAQLTVCPSGDYGAPVTNSKYGSPANIKTKLLRGFWAAVGQQQSSIRPIP